MFTENVIFTTVVKMNDFVNILNRIRRDIQGAGVYLSHDAERDVLMVESLAQGETTLKIVRLYRPSSAEVENLAAPNVLLVITAANSKAVAAAAACNHILIPSGGFRIVVPGVVLIRELPTEEYQVQESRQVRLQGQTGVVVETLLLGGKKHWAVRELSTASHISIGLTHRAVERLEQQGLITSHGEGHKKTRMVNDPQALAELWSDEEEAPQPILRGFLYSSSTEGVAQNALKLCPQGAVGAVLAANLYKPVLTRIPPPIRVWIPESFDDDLIKSSGFQETDEGANIEFVKTKKDSWQTHINREQLPKVSRWRAWLEISHAKGRTKELADILLKDLKESWYGIS